MSKDQKVRFLQELHKPQWQWENKKSIWKDQNISLQTKMKLLYALIYSIFLYACESWTLTAELQRKIQTTELRCLRRVLGIPYNTHTTEEVRRTITQHVNHYEDLLTIVKKRKLRWYGHVIRSNGLSKTVLQGTVQGKSGRQKKKWTDNITEWTKKTFAETQAVAHNRELWTQLVHQSLTVAPLRP